MKARTWIRSLAWLERREAEENTTSLLIWQEHSTQAQGLLVSYLIWDRLTALSVN
jgi:hypothetical protein